LAFTKGLNLDGLAVIGGSGFSAPEGFELAGRGPPEASQSVEQALDAPRLELLGRDLPHTPYGHPSAPIVRGRLGEGELLFLPRHGVGHVVPPHRVNYRANIWALRHCGAKRIVGLGAVGGIGPAFGPGVLTVPDQIIDYTHGRHQSFFEGDGQPLVHIDFTRPYCEDLRRALLAAAPVAGLELLDGGTYGVTQGPRLETAAEIERLERDGCDLVGMTGMPEAALARELNLCYACCAFVVNWAAGKAEGEIRMSDIEANIRASSAQVKRLLEVLVSAI